MIAAKHTLTTAEAAALLGVSVATLRRWATRGAVPSIRTAGGHRRFIEAELLRVTQREHTIASNLRWVNEVLNADGVFSLQASLAQELSRCGSWWGVATELSPCLQELQRRSAVGLLTPIQLHAHLERLQRALSRFLDYLSPERRPCLLIATVPSERTYLPLYLLSLCAAESRMAVRWGGATTPVELATELAREPADGIVISASSSSDRESTARLTAPFDALAKEVGKPFALLGAWPSWLDHATRLADLNEVHTWLAQHLTPETTPSP